MISPAINGRGENGKCEDYEESRIPARIIEDE
jgi:hypothetical protein